MGQRNSHLSSVKRQGFSLVELVIVVTIIGIIASIAVPRMSRASSNAESHALQATLANVRKAIDVYYAEHSKYPGYTPGTTKPDNDSFVDQLLLYSDVDGNTNASPTAVYRYGPYIRSPFPRNPRNELDTVYVKAAPVWAVVAGRAGSISTKEGVTHYRAGAYLVYNDPEGKDGYAVEADTFEEMYEPAPAEGAMPFRL